MTGTLVSDEIGHVRRSSSHHTPWLASTLSGTVRRLALPIAASVLGACLIGLLVYGITHQAASRTLDEAVAHGRHPSAPDPYRSLPALSGARDGELAAYRGQVVLLNFWASWCQPCEDEAPLLEHAQSELVGHHATVLGVTYKDATPDSEGFVRRFHLSYPNLRDASGSFAGAYGTDQLPESFLINRQGNIVAISRGEIEQGFINRALTLARST
jgi:cytochrome c biogenesis protein CcmG/thiol:disulfide interchange protein DsbE